MSVGRSASGEVDGSFELWLGARWPAAAGSIAGAAHRIPKPSPHPTNWTTNASGQLEELGDHGQAGPAPVALAFADLGRRDAGDESAGCWEPSSTTAAPGLSCASSFGEPGQLRPVPGRADR